MAETVQKLEEKELVDRARFLALLRNWQQSIENNQDFNVSVNGRQFTVPTDALDKGRFRVEYEIDEGEYEFELTLKWR
jgi:amphi-Trp domain-containing protein